MANKQKEIAKAAESAKKQAQKALKEIQKLSAESYVYSKADLLGFSERSERIIENVISECNKFI